MCHLVLTHMPMHLPQFMLNVRFGAEHGGSGVKEHCISLLDMLGHAGEQLSTGWEPLLRILEAVPEAEDAPCVSLAFQSVQLLASDYMSARCRPPLLRKCLQAAALYGAQQVRLNYSCSVLERQRHWVLAFQHSTSRALASAAQLQSAESMLSAC